MSIKLHTVFGSQFHVCVDPHRSDFGNALHGDACPAMIIAWTICEIASIRLQTVFGSQSHDCIERYQNVLGSLLSSLDFLGA